MTLGPIILAGGAEFDDRMDDADRVWLASGVHGVWQPRVGIFPTANLERPDKAAANGVGHFRRLVTHAEAVMVTSPGTTEDTRVLNQVSKLDFAYFAGGEPEYLASTLDGSAVWRALAERWRAGMGIGGSSAGAMVMAAHVFLQERWSEGLGILQGVVVRPHFNRHDEPGAERMRLAITSRGLVGLGVDEGSAAVWSQSAGWRAAGPGRVLVLGSGGTQVHRDGESIAGLSDPI